MQSRTGRRSVATGSSLALAAALLSATPLHGQEEGGGEEARVEWEWPPLPFALDFGGGMLATSSDRKELFLVDIASGDVRPLAEEEERSLLAADFALGAVHALYRPVTLRERIATSSPSME